MLFSHLMVIRFMWIFADFVWYLNFRGQFFFVIFFGGVCICMRILSYLFYIQICIGFFMCIYNSYSFVLYIQICIGFKNFLVAKPVFDLKMPYFKTTDNLSLCQLSSSYNADLRNIVNLLSLFICKDERVEI